MTISLMLTLAETYEQLGLYQPEAETTQQALALARMKFGQENVFVVKSLAALGWAQWRLGQHDQATRLATESLALGRRLLGDDDVINADSLQTLAFELEHFPEGEIVAREGLRILRKRWGGEHGDVAKAMATLGFVLWAQGRNSEAEPIAREALQLQRKALGNEHLETTLAMNKLAEILRTKGGKEELAEAEQVMREALTTQRRLLGNKHPEIAHSLNVLAEILFREFKPDEAESMWREALAVQPDFYDAVVFVESKVPLQLAALLEGDGRRSEAKTILEEEVARRKGGDLSQANAFAYALKVQGRFEGAETVLREQLARARAQSSNAAPIEPSELGITLSMLANVLAQQNRLSEAKSLTQEAVGRYQHHPDWPSFYRKDAFAVLSSILSRLGEVEEIERVTRQETRDSRVALQAVSEKWDTMAWNELAWLLATDPDPELRDGRTAIFYAERAVTASYRKAPNFLDTLAAAYAETGQFQKAVAVQKEAIALLKNTKEKRLFLELFLEHLKLFEGNTPVREPSKILRDPVILRDDVALTLQRGGKLDKSEALLQDTLAQLRKPTADGATAEVSNLGLILHHLADVRRQQKAFPEACSLAAEAVALYRRHPHWPFDERCHAFQVLADTFRDTGDLTGFDDFFREERAAAYQVVATTPSAQSQVSAVLFAARARLLVRCGRLKEAADEMSRALDLARDDHRPYHGLAALLVATGDLEGYRNLCQRILARFAETEDATVAERVANDCLILPSSGADLDKVARLANTSLTTEVKSWSDPWHQFCKGLCEYRQGHFAGAEQWVNKVINQPDRQPERDLEAYLVLAMSQHRLNRLDEARATLAKAVELADAKLPHEDKGEPGSAWIDRLIDQALLREAKGLIEGGPANQHIEGQ